MYAIAFDLIISELKKHYKDPYNNAYAEVKKVLEENGFFWIQGSTYATEGNLKVLFRAIQSLKNLRAFKIEDYSDFTEEFKLTI